MTMTTAYVTVTLIAIAANGFSGIAALLHFQPILPGMAKAGVPESWPTFPIGTLKTAGALGLVLFFVCAIYTHIRAGDYGPQFGLANAFLALNVGALALALN